MLFAKRSRRTCGLHSERRNPEAPPQTPVKSENHLTETNQMTSSLPIRSVPISKIEREEVPEQTLNPGKEVRLNQITSRDLHRRSRPKPNEWKTLHKIDGGGTQQGRLICPPLPTLLASVPAPPDAWRTTSSSRSRYSRQPADRRSLPCLPVRPWLRPS